MKHKKKDNDSRYLIPVSFKLSLQMHEDLMRHMISKRPNCSLSELMRDLLSEEIYGDN